MIMGKEDISSNTISHLEVSQEDIKKWSDRIEKEIDKETKYPYDREERKVNKKFVYLIKEGKNKNIRITYKKEFKSFSYVTYSCIRGVSCSVGNHNGTIDSRLIISSNRFDYFDFAFCKKCLNDLINIIFDFYHNDDIQLSREGNIKITTEDVEGQCISCGSTACKYDVTIGNRSFVMCRKCFEKFCENIMNTPAVRELFRPKYKEFRKTIQEEITQSENDRIVNNVFIPKDRDRVYSFMLNKFGAQNIDKFSYIPVHGIKCNFCDEESPSDAKVVLGTNREHNILALAYCPECAKKINGIVQRSIENAKTVYNKEKQIRCMVKSKFPQANYCYICGNKEGSAFRITHGNCSFSLCEKCVKKYANQLKSISEVE